MPESLMRPALWRGVLLLYVGLIAVVSLNPWSRPPSADVWFSLDNVAHAGAYFLLTILLALSMGAPVRPTWGRRLLVVMPAMWAAVVLGGLVELAQAYATPHRSGGWDDVLANTVGALLAGVVYPTWGPG